MYRFAIWDVGESGFEFKSLHFLNMSTDRWLRISWNSSIISGYGAHTRGVANWEYI